MPKNKPSKKLTNTTKPIKREKSFIPKVVADRMARRVAFTTGIPTFAGMSIFVLSYILVTKGIADISPGLTLAGSAFFFLIGILGLSFGILSASWDTAPGSLIGFENIGPNIEKIKSAFQNRDSV